MCIVIICDVLGKENNGTTVAAMNLIRSLREKGYEVRVVCPDENRRGEPGFYIVPTINFFGLNDYVRKNGVTLAKVDRQTLNRALEGADAVHTITPFFLSIAAAKLAQKKNIPLTSGFHCQAENFSSHVFMMNAKGFNHKVYQVFWQHFYSRVDCIHYPTQFIRDTFEQAIGRKTNGRVISNGVNAIFTPARGKKPAEYEGKFVVLFTGRYSKEKSHTVLIDAVARSKYANRIQLIFAGAGPREEYLRKYAAKRLPIAPRMEFFSRKELVHIIQFADLYVHPAQIEIEAIACLEAIACGLVPVISDSPRSATRYFALSRDNLFNVNDADDLAQRLDDWLGSPEKREACRQKYLGYAKRFALEHCMDEMEKMILENAEAKKNARRQDL